MNRNIRPAANAPDTAQAAAFLAILAGHLVYASMVVESAELAVADAKRSNHGAAVRRARNVANDVRSERDELGRLVRAILRRFPSLSAQHKIRSAVWNPQLAEAQ